MGKGKREKITKKMTLEEVSRKKKRIKKILNFLL